MRDNTNKTYKRAFMQFLKLSKLTENTVIKMNITNLAKNIDKVFENTTYKARTKRTYVFGTRKTIYEKFKIDLPKTHITESVSKDLPRKTNKGRLQKDDIKKLKDYFYNEYTTTTGKEQLNNLRNYMLFMLLVLTTQRIGDVLNSRVKDMKTNYIQFHQEKTGQEVVLKNPCQEETILYCHERKLRDEDYLFANTIDRTPLDYNQALKIIREAGLLVLNKRISPHYFRVYGITELRLARKTNAEIQTVSGHSTSAMIDYYAIESPDIVNLQDILL